MPTKQTFLRRYIKWLLKIVSIGVIGGFLMLLGGVVYVLDQKPKLSTWHTQYLNEEFIANGPVKTFQQYVELENRLFSELKSKIYTKASQPEWNRYNRYSSESKSDPAHVSPNWNRTYELAKDNPEAIAVMLHGLSDSPYSLRALGQHLHQQNLHVIGLRIPGHGTAPSGLLKTSWQDMAGAVRLAMVYAAQKAKGKPIILVGYSNGAALALNYAFNSINTASLRSPDRIVLFSPEIEVLPVALLAKWQAKIGKILRLPNLAWNTVMPEYDPYKYGSFAINAVNIAYQITGENQRLFGELKSSGKLKSLPPILAFQSIVDDTVSAKAVMTQLFDRLLPGDHELVLFDVNRKFAGDGLFKKLPDVSALFTAKDHPFSLHLATNTGPDEGAVELRTLEQGITGIIKRPLGLEWPDNVYSLTHISLPFSPGDPVYGMPEGATDMIQLGGLALYGEKDVLTIPTPELMRQHWNPFHPFVLDKVSQFIGNASAENP